MYKVVPSVLLEDQDDDVFYWVPLSRFRKTYSWEIQRTTGFSIANRAGRCMEESVGSLSPEALLYYQH